MNAWTVPLVAVKPADTGRNTTTTPTNDPDLQISVAAGAVYEVRAVIQYKGGTNGSSDAQFGLSVPAGSSGFIVVTRVQVTGSNVTSIAQSTFNAGGAVNAATQTTSVIMPCVIQASVTTAGTAGIVAVMWSQNTSNGTNTTVMANSVITAQRIG